MADDDDPVAGGAPDRWRALEEHTPQTVAEAGLELDPAPVRRMRAVVMALAAAAVVAGIVVVISLAGGGDDSILAVDLASCVTPIVTDVDAPVVEVACEPGAARLVARETHPAAAGDVHPGDGALELFGQGACQGRVAPDRLVVAVPSPTSWASGERAVACLERL